VSSRLNASVNRPLDKGQHHPPTSHPILPLSVFGIQLARAHVVWSCASVGACSPSVTCTVPLIAHADLNDYNLVVHEPWRGVPAACPGGVAGEVSLPSCHTAFSSMVVVLPWLIQVLQPKMVRFDRSLRCFCCVQSHEQC
jgi:hypothetical protein